jgi:hypothetical protein
MPELELTLRELGARIELPPTPDIASAVRRRLAEEPAPRAWFPRRRTLAIALAVLAAAIGAVMAVPPARTAVLEWLGIKGVTIVRVDKLPAVEPRDPELGERVSLEEARRLAGYRVLVPTLDGVGAPDEAYATPLGVDRQVSFVWRGPDGIRLLMTQFRGVAMAEKMVGPGTDAVAVDVDGYPGVWFGGAEHFFVYRDSQGEPREETLRLVGNALVWQRGELLLRLEGDLSKEQALDIARSVR